METTADPALDPLQPAQPSAPVGDPLEVRTALRNVGREAANDVTVSLYAGTPGSGTLLDSRYLAGPLEFNQTVEVSFTITVTPGLQPMYAELSTGAANASLLNDQAALTLGYLTAPVMSEVLPSDFTPEALEIAWYPSIDENAISYRVLRAESLDGPFEVIGETQQAAFTDVLVTRGVNYCYAVQSYNGGGNLSPQSNAICGALPLNTVFLPLVRR